MLSSGFVLAFSIFFAACITNAKTVRPHIIYIMADDLGWNDVSFHGSPQIPTPNIDALAASGIILNRHYVAPQCTPSRASLMTGRYPSNTSLSHLVITAGQPLGLPLNITILPQYLKNLGYATHMVGKWHLGSHKKGFTPTYRGFDSFFGCWNGEIDYYDYTHCSNENLWGIDLHDGLKPIKHLRSKYATGIFANSAENIIRKHDKSKPLFLFFSHIAPHTGNYYQRLQAPPEYVAKFKYIKDIKRRIFAGAVSALDESVGRVFAALYDRRMLSKSIVIFVSDNGAAVEGQRDGYGSNWPLRGAKANMYEGGVRVPALIWSPLFRLEKPRTSTQLMHICDWVPTLYAAAGGKVTDLGGVDCMNMWNSLRKNKPSPRSEIYLYADPISRMYSLIQNDYKIIKGASPLFERNLWYGPSGREGSNVASMDEWVWRNESVVKTILQRTGMWLIKEPDQWREDSTVNCGASSPPSGNGHCDPKEYPCLFNITEDPCEYRNLAQLRPEVVEDMMNRIRELNSTSLETKYPKVDLNADPRCHDFTFVTWLEPEHASEICDISNGGSNA